jgi:hypothetical protein
MKNTTPIIALLVLASASLPAQTSMSSKRTPVLSQDRVGVSFSKSGDAEYMTVSTNAALGEYLTASASYVDVGGDVLGYSLDGRLTRIGLGARFAVGSGEINFGYAYGIGAIVIGNGLAGNIGEQDAFSLGYRYAFSKELEFAVNISHLSSETAFGDFDVTPVTASIRYNIGQFDISAAFSTEDAYGLVEDENTFSLGVGVSF